MITHQDVTEQENLADQLAKQNALLQQREEELQAQNMRFDAALENMFQGLAMFDAEERIVIANDRFAEMYGPTTGDRMASRVASCSVVPSRQGSPR